MINTVRTIAIIAVVLCYVIVKSIFSQKGRKYYRNITKDYK